MEIIREKFDKNFNREIYFVKQNNNYCLGYEDTNKEIIKNSLDFPISVHINLTEKCNLRCKHCYTLESLTDEKSDFNHDQLIKLINKFDEMNVFSIEWSGGEPFENSKALDYFEMCEKKGFVQTVLTNGTILNEKMLNRMKKFEHFHLEVSIDGNKRACDDIKGKGTYNKILHNLKLLIENKISFITKVTIMESNISDIEELILDLVQIGVVNIKFGLLIPIGGAKKTDYIDYLENTLTKAKEKLMNIQREYKDKIAIDTPFEMYSNTGDIFGKRAKLCEAGVTRIYIDRNGDVYPCPLFKGIERFNSGNIYHKDINEIWNSKKINEIRNIDLDEMGCEECPHICKTWCRAISYTLSGSINKKSSLCKNKK